MRGGTRLQSIESSVTTEDDIVASPSAKMAVRGPLGRTGLLVPPILFGTSSLGNLYQAYSDETKAEILREMVRWGRLSSPRSDETPLVLDSAGKYGAGLALETIGAGLRALDVPAEGVLINNKLGWARVALREPEPTFEPGVWVGLKNDAEQDISHDGIVRCWEQGNALLGAPYTAELVSVHDPDEYLARAPDASGRARAKHDIVEAYRALYGLKRDGKVRAVGVGAKDWRVIRELADEVELDWVMLACSLTVFHHPPQVLALVESLHHRGIGIINSAVFHSGFLTGGRFFDYRIPDPTNAADAPLFTWRERFVALCKTQGVDPAAACVRFGLSVPGVVAIALNTSRPEQVRRNVALGAVEIPRSFWIAAKDAGLVRRDFPYLP
jgi:D-threo-aldose 1-dehydrogenase